jgi:hypothetical protein
MCWLIVGRIRKPMSFLQNFAFQGERKIEVTSPLRSLRPSRTVVLTALTGGFSQAFSGQLPRNTVSSFSCVSPDP